MSTIRAPRLVIISLASFCIFATSRTAIAQCEDWTVLGYPAGGYAGDTPTALAVFNGDLIAAGVVADDGYVFRNTIHRWNGSAWEPLGNGLGLYNGTSNNGTVKAMMIYQGNLIIAGNFDSIDGVSAYNIAQWDGSAWSALDQGLISLCGNPPFNCGNVNALEIFNGDLIAGGGFTQAGSVISYHLGRWDGKMWHSMGHPEAGPGNAQISTLTVFQDSLYAGGGYFNNYRWDGTTWHAVPGCCGVEFVTANSQLFMNAGVGGQSTKLSVWNGSGWTFMVNTTYLAQFSTHNGDLIASGLGDSLNTWELYQWNGSTWRPIGGDSDPYVYRSFTEWDGRLVSARGTFWGYLNNVYTKRIGHPADVNCTGTVDVNDLLAVINGWGACPKPCPPHCAADVTHDCSVNVNDLLAVINAWGLCP